MSTISIIILGQNVAEEIEAALVTSQFADEIVYVDTFTGSTDETLKLVRHYKAKIVKSPIYNFSTWRNDGAKAAISDWLLYLDSDERLTTKLIEEIRSTVNQPTHDAYTISRYEVFLGKHLSHWPDSRVLRLIKKNSLLGWHGKLHEQPKIDGTIGDLNEPMIHLSHKNIDEKVISTMKWSKLEAEMLLKSNHPQMVGWRFIRIMFTEFWTRFVKQDLWRDGTEGIIEVIYQMFSRFITYERLWELQRDPSLKKTYQNIDKQLTK